MYLLAHFQKSQSCQLPEFPLRGQGDGAEVIGFPGKRWLMIFDFQTVLQNRQPSFSLKTQ